LNFVEQLDIYKRNTYSTRIIIVLIVVVYQAILLFSVKTERGCIEIRNIPHWTFKKLNCSDFKCNKKKPLIFNSISNEISKNLYDELE